MRRVGILLMLAGCDAVFGIDGHSSPDAAADAVADAAAGCWSATELGNEDGDEFVDGCDPCPADAEVGRIDLDGDSVGDACDLEPDSAQHTIAFDGFAAPHGWHVKGPWAIENGDYEQAVPTGGAAAELDVPAGANPMVDVRFTVRAPCATPGCGPGAYAALADHRGGCKYQYESGTDSVAVVVDDVVVASMAPSAEGMPDRIVVGVRPELAVVCWFYKSGQVTAKLAGPADLPTATTTRVGLVADLVQVDFHSITVFADQR